jgi:predicted NBD/HSP70 family sugar kinase
MQIALSITLQNGLLNHVPSRTMASKPLPDSELQFLRTLREHALGRADSGLTPLELEQLTGLSRPSVTNLIKRFAPVLIERREERPARLAVDPAAGVAVGVDIGHEHVAVAVADLDGRIAEPADPAAYERLGPQITQDADAVLDWVVAAIERHLGELRIGPADVAGIGITMAGPIDREHSTVRQSPAPATAARESDWELFDARDQLRRRLGWDQVPMLFENDANAAALAELLWGAARRPDGSAYRNVIYVEWSAGIGAGLVLGGALYRGCGVAGELGHFALENDGERCVHCGNRGCLETLVGWDALRARVADADDLPEVLALAHSGDPAAEAALKEAAGHMARALGPLISVLNPELVVIGGTVGTEGYDVVRPTLVQSLKRCTMRPALKDVEVVGAELRGRTSLRGAIALVLHTPPGDSDALVHYLLRTAARAREGGNGLPPRRDAAPRAR